jgi:hypothetical protein
MRVTFTMQEYFAVRIIFTFCIVYFGHVLNILQLTKCVLVHFFLVLNSQEAIKNTFRKFGNPHISLKYKKLKKNSQLTQKNAILLMVKSIELVYRGGTLKQLFSHVFLL